MARLKSTAAAFTEKMLLGVAADVPTPVNDTVVGIIKARERGVYFIVIASEAIQRW